MTFEYASTQPAGYHNYIRKVAIVGATGQQGSYIVRELISTGKHTVTAISREDSTSTPAPGVKVSKVNYNDPSTLVAALQGQDALIITMSITAPPDSSVKLIEAAAKAGVPWVIPNEWGVTHEKNLELGKDVFTGPAKEANRDLISKLGVSSWTAVSCGFWYEYSLGTMKDMYGFDLQKKEVTFFDKGETKMDTSTWDQVARAVKALLSTKILPENEQDTSPSLVGNFKDKSIFVSSFCVSQKDMFESLKRVTRTADSDWKIDSEDSKERYNRAVAEMNAGSQLGFVKALYTRCFYPDEPVLFERYGGLSNDILGLPVEDLDTCTKGAIERSNAIAAATKE